VAGRLIVEVDMLGRMLLVVAGVTIVTAGIARVGMRLVALATGQETHLGLSGTAGIALLFLLAAIGGVVSGAVRWAQPWRTLPVVVGSALLFVAAASIGVSEVISAFTEPGGLGAGPGLGVIVATALILLAALACPVLAWRLGAGARGRGGAPHAAVAAG
jgi:hypothetical protein